MTAREQVSVIVVSRGRPTFLERCLTGLGQLFYPEFEIIVVADPAGVAAVAAMGWRDRIKTVPFDEANISAARNAGIAQAAGTIVAFIDDDAVPEPTWLDHLSGPFTDPAISAAGGYVRGRNGISFQWRGRLVDRLGYKHEIAHAGDAPFVPEAGEGLAVKTEGTNCAFRREVLSGLGGFDPAFRFYLDETDLNMRLAKAGRRTALVPMAQVHHGYAASDRRGGDRTPTDLGEIGASSMVYWRKHAPPQADLDQTVGDLMADQRARLIRFMVQGGLEPGAVKPLLDGLAAGLDCGRSRPIHTLPPIEAAQSAFLPFRRAPTTGASIRLAGRVWSRRRLRRLAMARVHAGDVVTVYRFSHTAQPHVARFLHWGFWEQRGGLFGLAERDEPRFRLSTLGTRVNQEWRRVARQRQPEKK